MHSKLPDQSDTMKSKKTLRMSATKNKEERIRDPSCHVAGETFETASTEVHLLYANAFSRVAKKYNVILGIRAPNPLGQSLLRENYPSKSFHIKAKSSASGPTAGFIAESPIYSKVKMSAYKKQGEHIANILKKGAKALSLKISKQRIDELIHADVLEDLKNGQYQAYYPSGLHKFVIQDDGLVLDEQYNPVRVISNLPELDNPHAEPRPITADYDLFTIIPRENQSINLRPLVSAPKLMRGKFNLDYTKPRALPGQNEDIDMGNLHEFGKKIVHSLNKEIKAEGYQGGKLVWHNDETGNPFSPGFDIADKPIFIHPLEPIIQVNSIQELLDYYKKLKSQRYAPEYSPIFGF